METQIKILTEEMKVNQQTNIGEIVNCVMAVLDSSNALKPSPDTMSTIEKGLEKSPRETNEEDIFVNCDNCQFKCENEESMIAHMSTEHEECPFCYFCGKYFGTKKFLKDHNSSKHKELHDMTESESEDNTQLTKHVKKVKQKKKNRKK